MNVVVTRDEPENGPLSEALRGLGLAVRRWPVVRSAAPADAAPLAAALAHLAEVDWIVFTSRHAVSAVAAELAHLRLGMPAHGVRIAAVGERTAAALRERHWPLDLLPEEASAEALVRALVAQLSPGARVLFPASSRALPTLPEGLRAHGIEVIQVEAYRTESAPLDAASCHREIERGDIGAVTFTSPSTVIELDRALGAGYFDRLLEDAATVALGATTARALAARGHVCALAAPTTLAGLAATTYRLLQLRA
ncbi:MAG TPA: uroporphyrinogen-III synthase [Steroidobacteraceae bacterium]|nr:uroporphyrinogen-III synthase [Steroidobacteraceae bacterium]